VNIKVIYPACESDFSEFIHHPLVMIKETIHLYKHASVHHFRSIGSEEKNKGNVSRLPRNEDQTIFRDSDPITGFILIKEELKNCSCSSLHIRAVAQLQSTEFLSIRDLTDECIPWLVKLRDKCVEQLTNKYEISSSRLECYVSYPPSSFPFHVFFETVQKDLPLPVTTTHYLETIISNLKVIPDYYQKITLTYSLPETDPLLSKLRDAQNNSNKDEYRNND
ncbi:m7GpppX diphosphatase-like, partial [Stegodyphus dumicola]|uniref:m7GpppX diphosphatase-like n=1 Tax=Stegodyphus dumicola TaxID=202533 RepID=UPI0015B220E3